MCVCMCVYVRVYLSHEADTASEPSAEMASELTESEWPVRTREHTPLCHTRTVLSCDPLTTIPLCSSCVRTGWKVERGVWRVEREEWKVEREKRDVCANGVEVERCVEGREREERCVCGWSVCETNDN